MPGPGELSAVSSPAAHSYSHEYSCVLCKQRKVRCDRGNPCSACTKLGADCVPGTRAPYKRRKRLRGGPPGNSEVAQLHTSRPRSHESRKSQDVGKAPRIVPAFGHNLWTGLNEDFQEPANTRGSDQDEDDAQANGDDLNPSPADLLFASTPRLASLREWHPSPMNAFMLWQTFLQNVNPLSKVIHAPVVQQQVIEASRDFDSMSRPSIALLFAIYASAVMSMKDEECLRTLGESRKTLQARYLSVCQQALAAANFMRSPSTVILQAFTIFLLAARSVYDVQTMWLLTGMAMRMGQRLNPQADTATSQDQSMYDMQLRRRLWWQIVWLDGRGHQAAGHKIMFSEAINFPHPLNLNDSDLSPNMTELPPPHKGPTEMTFCLIRYEMGKFLTEAGRKLHNPATPIEERDEIIDTFEHHMQENYLKYLDPAINLHMLAAGGGQAAIWKMRMMAHHPAQYADKGKSLSQEEHDKLFYWSVQLVECHVQGKSTKDLDRFAWHIDAIFQLDAFVFMLIESRSQPPTGPLTEKAWHLVDKIYEFRPILLAQSANTLYAAVNELTLRAWDAREREIARQGLGSVAIPDIVATLRYRRQGKSQQPSEVFPQPEIQVASQLPAMSMQANPGFDLSTIDLGGPQIMSLPNVGYLFDGIFDVFPGDVALPDWGAVNWDDWNTLLEQNVIT